MPDRRQIPSIWRSRFDYFLIWGHGVKHADEIIARIASTESLRIVRIQYYRPPNLPRFVRAVYSHDYAPFHHLKAKTRYLLETEPLVLIVVVENECPGAQAVGTGAFRHFESPVIKVIKEDIRDRFNEKLADRRTENHVIHASDNEEQTDKLLKHIGLRTGIDLFLRRPNPVLDVVYHLQPFTEFKVQLVNADSLSCRILQGTPHQYDKLLLPIDQTPQTLFLKGHHDPYRSYLAKFTGWLLTDYYSLSNFADMAKRLDYQKMTSMGRYIVAERTEAGRLAVLDGVHRAAILNHRKVQSFPVVVVA